MKKREMKGKREGWKREKISSWLAVIWQLLQATRPQISLADCSHDAIWVGGGGAMGRCFEWTPRHSDDSVCLHVIFQSIING